MRYCKIESASIELANGAGDGAYGLLGVIGSPEQIGNAIAEELTEGDMLGNDNRYRCGEDQSRNLAR
jgi:hypothetical protein